MAIPRRVALLIETSNAYARGLLQGIMGYVREHTPWAFRLTEHGRGEVRRNELAGWDGHGVIARIENPRVAQEVRRFRGPVIDVSAAQLIPGIPWVETDDEAIARLAADHLLERGFRHFAFCGDSRFNWSRWRGEEFQRYLGERGHVCRVAQRLTGDDLADWVLSLPRPVGVLACYDIRGREVIDACRRAQLMVPDQVAVIGVDDDELLCELSDPPLSSVSPDVRHTGWVAAELLDRLMRGRKVPGVRYAIPPLGIQTRRSTDILAIEDPDVAAALRFIRAHAAQAITVEDVVRSVPLSRRMLEARFQQLLGRTPHEEIIRCRLEQAKRLLLQRGLTLNVIARQTGFGHGEYFNVVFKRETGETPGAYRRRHGV